MTEKTEIQSQQIILGEKIYGKQPAFEKRKP